MLIWLDIILFPYLLQELKKIGSKKIYMKNKGLIV